MPTAVTRAFIPLTPVPVRGPTESGVGGPPGPGTKPGTKPGTRPGTVPGPSPGTRRGTGPGTGVGTRRPRKPFTRRRPGREQLVRQAVQLAFVLLNLWIGARFYLFVRYYESGGTTLFVDRPPGV